MNASRISEATGAGQGNIRSGGSTNSALSDQPPKEESAHHGKRGSALCVRVQGGRGRQEAKSVSRDSRGAEVIFLLFTKLFLQFFLDLDNEPSDLLVKCR